MRIHIQKKADVHTFIKVLVVLVLFNATSQKVHAQARIKLGVNLDDNGAFTNIINHTNRYSNATGYDQYGWPISDFDLVLLDGRPATEWNATIDDPEIYRVNYSGRYKSSFTGSANVRVSGTSVSIENTSYDAQTNITFFDVVVGGYPNANHGLVFLNFSNTRRTAASPVNSGITQLKVMRPGYELTTTKIFTDEFIRLCKAAEFACYRFYNLQNIWDGEPTYPQRTTWQQRKTPLDASQKPLSLLNQKRDGWCWEYVIELANILKKDIWICIHMSCDSNYVTSLARMLKDDLDPSINIYVENSNEVWSPTQTTHGPYNQAEATFYQINFNENYARRTVELSRWFSTVYGSSEINNKIRVILAGQHSYHGRNDIHLNYIRSTFGEPKNFIYAISTALYFGSTKSSDSNPLSINDGMIDEINNQISNVFASTYRLNHIDKAQTWGLKGGCTSYEGGPHLPAGGGTANLGNQIMAHRTAKMGEVTKLNYDEGWNKLGGGLAIYFTLSSAYNRYGCWGITDDYTNPDRNFKMKAIRDLIGGTTRAEDIAGVENKEFSITYDRASTSVIIYSPPPLHVKKIHIFNYMGQKIAESNTSPFVVTGVHSGVYFITVSFTNDVQGSRMIFIEQ